MLCFFVICFGWFCCLLWLCLLLRFWNCSVLLVFYRWWMLFICCVRFLKFVCGWKVCLLVMLCSFIGLVWCVLVSNVSCVCVLLILIRCSWVRLRDGNLMMLFVCWVWYVWCSRWWYVCGVCWLCRSLNLMVRGSCGFIWRRLGSRWWLVGLCWCWCLLCRWWWKVMFVVDGVMWWGVGYRLWKSLDGRVGLGLGIMLGCVGLVVFVVF